MSLPVPIPESSKEKHARYPEYKDSEIEWLGDIPAHWDLKKIKWDTPVSRGASPRPIDDPIYFDEFGEYAWVRIADVTDSGEYLEKTTQRLSDIGANLSVKLEPGDMFLSIAGSVGKPCITKIKCCIHDGFVYFPRLKINNKFIYYIFASGEPYKGLGKLGTQLNLNTDTVASISIGIPPTEEQQAIADYLDQETTKIDQLVEKKKRLIELLEEQRTAIITHAVTKGLNPGVEMKDSGVEWLGEIPAHWDLKKLKHVTTCLDGKRVPLNSEQRGYIQGGYPYWGANGILDYIDNWLFDEQLILLGEDGAPFFEANKTVAFLVEGKIWVNNHAHVLRVLNSTNARFLTNVLNVVQYRQFIEGSTRDKLTQDSMNNIPIQFAPINEQQAIADYLDKETTRIDNLINKINQAIEKLQEYRSALITAAVTGKIDVRQHVS
jgi:type I restriction enzyme S subunit